MSSFFHSKCCAVSYMSCASRDDIWCTRPVWWQRKKRLQPRSSFLPNRPFGSGRSVKISCVLSAISSAAGGGGGFLLRAASDGTAAASATMNAIVRTSNSIRGARAAVNLC